MQLRCRCLELSNIFHNLVEHFVNVTKGEVYPKLGIFCLNAQLAPKLAADMFTDRFHSLGKVYVNVVKGEVYLGNVH